jgi:membrane fusion protein, multidrug efflux system
MDARTGLRQYTGMINKTLALGALVLLGAAAAFYGYRASVGKAPAASGGPAGTAGAGTAPAGTVQGTAPPPQAQSVSVVRAQQRDVPVTIEATGTVVALNTVEVRPQVSAMLRQVAIREGQFVRKGDLLFALDDRADRANLEKARAQLLKNRATLADLERQLKRSQELRDQNFIAQSAVDTVLSGVEAQRAAVAADEAAIHVTEVALGYNQIRAPLSGRAGAITVSAGSLVSQTGAPLVTINQIDPIGVAFSVPEAQLAPLLQGSRGEPATVTLRLTGQGGGSGATAVGAGAGGGPRPGAESSAGAGGAAPGGAQAGAGAGGRSATGAVTGAAPAANPGPAAAPAAPPAITGKVSFIDSAVDTQSGTIRVKGTFANPGQLLWPGQYVTARMTMRTIKDAVVVPQAALILGATQQRTLYIVDDANTAQLRAVQVRYGFGEFAVVDGVKPGERIVTDGKQNLRPGTPVRDAGAAPPVTGARASGPAAAASRSAP